MNKKELVGAIADRASVSKKVSNSVLDAMLDVIMEAISEGEDVVLVGFGTFRTTQRKERAGRNPRTGESITIPETVVPGFSAGKNFKEMVASK